MEDLNGYFAVHSQGLGHASRAIALARGLTARRPDIGLLFLAGSPALDLVVSNGFDALTFPSVPDWPERDGSLDPVWRWYAEYARYLRLARRFLRKEADWRFNRFLISDGEIASVREAIRHGVPTAMVLHTVRHDFARDAVSRAVEGAGNAWFARLARKIDLILAVDDTPPWPNVRRIEPIARPFSAPRDVLRERLVFRKRTVLVTAGGTGIGGFLVREAVDAFRDLHLEYTSMVVVSGPKLRVEPASGVYVYGFVPNLQDMILAADLVITTAGKGTIAEAHAAGTPVIAIPPKGHVEMERNAARLGYSHDDVRRLRRLIPETLDRGRQNPRPLGNERAVDLLLEFLEGRVSEKR